MKLDSGCINMMRLAKKGAEQHGGWAPVSKAVWPMLNHIPAELLEREALEDGRGRCRLTEKGETVLAYA